MKTQIKHLFISLMWLALPALVQAQFTFTTNNGAITITGFGGGGDVVIPAATNGYPVTSIGTNAFYENYGITNVTIPASVTSIGDYAFEYCTRLTSVTIPASVTSFGDYAFAYCWSLANVDIAAGVTEIGDFAFAYCSILTNVTIPASVTSIGEAAFDTCTSLKTVTIPASITSIGDEAFENCGLTGVAIPDSVTNIGEQAFFYCLSLTNVTIPASVTSIGAAAFALSSLTNINVDVANPAYSSLGGVLFDEAQATLIQFPGGLGGSYVIPDSVTSLAVGSFEGCSLTSVNIPNSVTSFGDQAFAYCPSLTSVTIPSSVTNIGDQAFTYCTSLTSVTIPNGVNNIGDGTFDFCFGLTSVSIPDSVTSIGDQAFEDCYSLTSVTIPNGVTNIGDQAFHFCSSLTSVDIPSSVTSIGDYAFENCYSLTNAYFLGNAPPDDTTAFNSDSTIVYYQTDTIGWGSTFGGSPTMSWSPFTYTLNDGAITITGYDTTAGLDMVIPTSINGYPVTSIGTEAFDSYISLTSVSIPNSVTNIGDEAFYECLSLTSVNIPNSVISIGYNAFFFCDSLTNVNIPSSVTSISDYAFFNCTSLTAAYFLGNAPPDDGTVFTSYSGTDPATVYYLSGITGWGSTFGSVPAVLWNPVIQTNGANFGVSSNQFGFNITGTTNFTLVVEACTNLASPVWTPLQTVTLTNCSFYFSDAQWKHYPARFYSFGVP